MRRFATLPLMHQPGEKWMYNTGAEVLGVLIARASGQRLETFFRERLFDPLAMKDTALSVPPAKLDRLATSYLANPQTGALEVYDGVQGQWSRPPAFRCFPRSPGCTEISGQRRTAPLDVFVVRKLGIPGDEEFATGAIASGGVLVLNREVIEDLYSDMSAYLARRIEQTPNIEVLRDTTVLRMNGDKHLASVTIVNNKTGGSGR
jgi:CubicO group peptidase (beta-lactamase class C family)